MFICDCCKKLCDMMDMFGTEDDDYHVCYSCANKLGFLHEKMELEAKMNHDLYVQTVRTLTLNYETLVIEKYGKDVLLSTSPKCVEALSKLYQSTLLTQMQRLEKEESKFKGLVAYHERVNKLSSELEYIAPNVNYTTEKPQEDNLLISYLGAIITIPIMVISWLWFPLCIIYFIFFYNN